jgi:hypothetical protein
MTAIVESAPVRPKDRAVLAIAFSNLLAVAGVGVGDGGILMLLWPYFIQSVVIGIFARRRVLALRRFSTKGLEKNGRPVEATPEAPREAANSWGCVYLFFHFGYALFLTSFTVGGLETGYLEGRTGSGVPTALYVGRITVADAAWLLVVAASFVASHYASHREHLAADLKGSPSLSTLVTLPYLRIIPMHVTIIVALWLGDLGGLLLFAGLKTVVDIAMHRVEHRMLQKSA